MISQSRLLCDPWLGFSGPGGLVIASLKIIILIGSKKKNYRGTYCKEIQSPAVASGLVAVRLL